MVMTFLRAEMWAVIAGLGAAGGWLLRAWWAHTDKREERISMRESRAWAEADARAAKMEKRINELAEEVRIASRLCTVTVGALHIFADELVTADPTHGALARVANYLQVSYPCPEGTPAEMAQLIARLNKVQQ